MNTKDILKRFGLEIDKEPISIYPFSPVYKVQYGKQQVIIKKTKSPLSAARKLMRFTESLNMAQVNIVTPVESDTFTNPLGIEKDVFVMYPFIEGYTYTAKDEEIYAAGQLLGKIHYLSPQTNNYQLPVYDVFDFTKQEVTDHMITIRQHIQHTKRKLNVDLVEEKLIQAVDQQTQLQEIKLPFVATPHDYKANNLIYTPEPYLIDPDNATWIPRIFDLALSLLLFHNELETAPDTLFNPKQWKLFLSGYTKWITLTDLEKKHWQYALSHVFLDEVMWLMAEYEEDWINDEQYKLFKSIIKIFVDSSAYLLD
ncbi:Ser/Thr protein kinase RdoA (MazF antagonist) [Lysinibacillus parviboronicapiens]|uniref:Ser/Thr protein kinase RdoA (MazF antagonist) n=1 Tax=Lysinibacillus parviboronicapiens TaxID=436516 RepID=A0ABV2PFY6_9BACI